jgi:hypothetical protein
MAKSNDESATIRHDSRVPVLHRMQPRTFYLYHRLLFPRMDGLSHCRRGSGIRRPLFTAALRPGV